MEARAPVETGNRGSGWSRPTKRTILLAALVSAAVATPGDGQSIISADGMIESTAGGFKFPDGTVQTTAQETSVDDGILWIHQDCASGAGCFAGDDPGFPVEIGSSGSYRLASNLDIRGMPMAEDLSVIVVDVPSPGDVTIDLSGFLLLGPNNCPGTPPSSCTANGTGVGIQTNDNSLTVRNGGIRGMGDDGIRGVSALRVERVRVEDCGGDGIDASGFGGVFRENMIRRNGGNGIAASNDHLVTNNLIHGNIGTGLVLGSFSAYGGNFIRLNGGTVTGSALVQLGENACDGNSTCP